MVKFHAHKEIYEFGKYRLDVAERLLSREGERVPLPEKAFETLCALVRRGNRLASKEELLSEIWAGVVVEENNLDKNISLLRRALGERPGGGKFIETVRGHGFRFLPEVREIETDEDGGDSKGRIEAASALAGDPTSGTPAGADALDPTESQITDPEFQNAGRTVKKKNRFGSFSLQLFASLALLIAIGLSALYFRRQTSPKTPIKTIAVLPFKPLVEDKRDEALELGMADALIVKLSGGEGITVRPLSAVRRYGALEQDAVAAGRDLGVQIVLDGSVQISGDRVRVLAKLLSVGDGKQLWAERFDEKFTDIFEVQDSISERVAAALKVRLGGEERKRYTANVEAYQLYMKGRYHTLRLTRAETDKGIRYFQQAIELDPNYALAYVGLAEAYLPMALTSGVPSWEVLPKAKTSALRAVELDDTLAEVHVALGFVYFWYEWDWQAAEKQYVRALELNPNSAEARFAYAHLLSNSRQHEKAAGEIRRARELDPLSLRVNALEGQILFFAGKHDEALDHLSKTIDLDPNFWLSHLFISRVYSEKGMHPEAIAAAKKAGEISGNSQSDAYRAYALAKWGKHAEARALLEELLKQSGARYVPPYNIALIYKGLGERDKALDYLEKGFAEKDVRMVFLTVEPMWDSLRSDPSFISLLKRMRIE